MKRKVADAELLPPAAQFDRDTWEKFTEALPPSFQTLRLSGVSCPRTNIGNKIKTSKIFFIFLILDLFFKDSIATNQLNLTNIFTGFNASFISPVALKSRSDAIFDKLNKAFIDSVYEDPFVEMEYLIRPLGTLYTLSPAYRNALPNNPRLSSIPER